MRHWAYSRVIRKAPFPTGARFLDVPCDAFAGGFIEHLAELGITAGCGGGLYCPTSAVTREQMAVFLIRSLEGASYTPPPATGIFADVPTTSIYARWIEELSRRGFTAGCGGANFCP